MGKQIRKYFNIIWGKTNLSKIHINGFKFVFIAILIIISSCENNRINYQNADKETSANIVKQELNCTGYIKVVQKNGNSFFLIIDTVEWFNGEAAKKAFDMDKKEGINKKSELPEGYYIRNLKIDSLKFKVSDTTKVIMQTFSYSETGNYNFNEKIQISKFLKILSSKEFKRFKFKPYKFHIVNNKITSIEEIYLP